jgi:hypothetical protein
MRRSKERRAAIDDSVPRRRDLAMLFELDGEMRLDLDEYAEEIGEDLELSGPRAREIEPLVGVLVTAWPTGKWGSNE